MGFRKTKFHLTTCFSDLWRMTLHDNPLEYMKKFHFFAPLLMRLLTNPQRERMFPK